MSTNGKGQGRIVSLAEYKQVQELAERVRRTGVQVIPSEGFKQKVREIIKWHIAQNKNTNQRGQDENNDGN